MTPEQEAEVAELQALLDRIYVASGVAAERVYALGAEGVIQGSGKVGGQVEAHKHQLSHARDNLDTQLRRARMKAARAADVLPEFAE